MSDDGDATGVIHGQASADRAARGPDAAHYVRDTLAYHRPPDAVFHDTVVDRPKAYRTYPHVIGRLNATYVARIRSRMSRLWHLPVGDGFRYGIVAP